MAPYHDLEAARRALEDNVQPVLWDLAREGYVETASASGLGIDRLSWQTEASAEGIAIRGVQNDENEDVSILVEARIDRGIRSIEFSVNPEAETVVASVIGLDGSVVHEVSNTATS